MAQETPKQARERLLSMTKEQLLALTPEQRKHAIRMLDSFGKLSRNKVTYQQMVVHPNKPRWRGLR